MESYEAILQPLPERLCNISYIFNTDQNSSQNMIELVCPRYGTLELTGYMYVNYYVGVNTSCSVGVCHVGSFILSPARCTIGDSLTSFLASLFLSFNKKTLSLKCSTVKLGYAVYLMKHLLEFKEQKLNIMYDIERILDAHLKVYNGIGS
ncbi:hypothetical protein LOTGIDRAFT_175774 [Lottia gigantea]|uniref:Uncharacterized protein n=1 Tax=Lottia gigantea TaxID=225164 RepID=V4BRL0_LOTGI|nr:hypothetical protein LOTGIDRAFT_175774 [Lottia gigantea]ESO91529.1 hypothetical protein LOTGIDRAFT_175774 [Lottia gigantea]